jgi:hypothetical protein
LETFFPVDNLWITLASAVTKKMPGEQCSTRAVVRSTVDEGGPLAAILVEQSVRAMRGALLPPLHCDYVEGINVSSQCSQPLLPTCWEMLQLSLPPLVLSLGTIHVGGSYSSYRSQRSLP